MAAHIIALIDLENPMELGPYQELAAASMQKYNVRFVAKAPKPEVLEGDFPQRIVVLLEADSADAVRTWYNSPEYKAAIEARPSSSEFTILVVGD